MTQAADPHADFRRWADQIKRQPGDAKLREAQIILLDRAIAALDAGLADPVAAAELEAWALMQEQHRTQYPSMVAAFRWAATCLRDYDVPATGDEPPEAM